MFRARSFSFAYARFVLLVAGAATLAYWIGNKIPHTSGLIASVTALITIQPTLHKSVKETVWQVVGLVAGVTIVGIITQRFGFTPLVLFGAIAVGYTIARLLRVDPSDAPSVVVPIIIIVGTTSISTETVLQRTYGALLGASIAIAVSMFVHPGSPHKRALTGAVECAEVVSEILQRIADTIPDGLPSERVTSGWLNELFAVQTKLVSLREDAEDAYASVRWSPLLNREETREALTQVKITQATVGTAINMCRDLVVASQQAGLSRELPPPLANSLSDVISGTADIITEQASAAAAEKAAAPLPASGEEAEAVADAVRETIGRVKDTESTGAILIGSSLLRDSEKIAAMLTGSHGGTLEDHPAIPPTEKPKNI